MLAHVQVLRQSRTSGSSGSWLQQITSRDKIIAELRLRNSELRGTERV